MKHLGSRFFLFLILLVFFSPSCRDKDHPIPPKNLWELIESQKDLSILETAILRAGLQPLFEEQGPYTVFAPTNEAFLAFFEEFGFSAGLVDFAPHDTQLIVLYHVIDNMLPLNGFGDEAGYPTLFNGYEIFVSRQPGTVSINDVSKVVVGDFEASNGLLHVVDRLFFIKAQDGSVGIPGADGGQVGGGNNPNRRGP